MYSVVVLDDERRFNPDRDSTLNVEIDYFVSSASCLDFLSRRGLSTPLDELWLDHDLGGDDTSRPLVMEMASDAFWQHPWSVNTVYIHTANPVGAKWIESTLAPFYSVVRVAAADYGLTKTGD